MNAPAQRRGVRCGARRRTAAAESQRRGCENGRSPLALARLTPLALALLISLALLGCERSGGGASDTSFRFLVQPDPAAVGPVTVEITLADKSGAPRTGASLLLEGNMSHPGMKPSMAEAAEVRPGVYHAELELTMRGDWILTATATFPDGTRAEGTQELPGVTGS